MENQAQNTHPEVLLCDGQRVEYLGIDLVILQVDKVHLLSDLLESSL